MDGQFTAYFPNDISLEVMEMEREQMLVVVQNEIERTDFEGMRVSYDNAPFPTISTIVETNESVNSDNGNGGLSIGVIIGIIVTCIILVAVIAVIIIRHKKEQEQSAVVPESVQQSKQNGHDNKEYDSDFDGSSSSSDSLSSEDEDYEISESSMQSSMPD
jgi:flagellar biosynthesis/type III secretory pathway M-ring protein FliF/YscJ